MSSPWRQGLLAVSMVREWTSHQRVYSSPTGTSPMRRNISADESFYTGKITGDIECHPTMWRITTAPLKWNAMLPSHRMCFLRGGKKMFCRKFTPFYLMGFLLTTRSLCKTDAWGAMHALTCGLWLYFIFFLFQFLQTTWNPTLGSSGSISAQKKAFSLSSQHTSSGVRAAMSIAVGMLTSCSGHFLLMAICMVGWAVTLVRGFQPQQWVPHTVLHQAVQRLFPCLENNVYIWHIGMCVPALGQDDGKAQSFPTAIYHTKQSCGEEMQLLAAFTVLYYEHLCWNRRDSIFSTAAP